VLQSPSGSWHKNDAAFTTDLDKSTASIGAGVRQAPPAGNWRFPAPAHPPKLHHLQRPGSCDPVLQVRRFKVAKQRVIGRQSSLAGAFARCHGVSDQPGRASLPKDHSPMPPIPPGRAGAPGRMASRSRIGPHQHHIGCRELQASRRGHAHKRDVGGFKPFRQAARFVPDEHLLPVDPLGQPLGQVVGKESDGNVARFKFFPAGFGGDAVEPVERDANPLRGAPRV